MRMKNGESLYFWDKEGRELGQIEKIVGYYIAYDLDGGESCHSTKQKALKFLKKTK